MKAELCHLQDYLGRVEISNWISERDMAEFPSLSARRCIAEIYASQRL